MTFIVRDVYPCKETLVNVDYGPLTVGEEESYEGSEAKNAGTCAGTNVS